MSGIQKYKHLIVKENCQEKENTIYTVTYNNTSELFQISVEHTETKNSAK